MVNRKIPPIGITDFEEITGGDFYYVDKTTFIKDLLQNRGKANLFTRPRRFGKTLTLHMLKCFFEIGKAEHRFDGLAIREETAICEKYMGQFPVIFISFKDVGGKDFEKAFSDIRRVIGIEAIRFEDILTKDSYPKFEYASFHAMTNIKDGKFLMDRETLSVSIRVLTQLLYSHYGKKSILLIDEYDVPLDKAYQEGYYDEMVDLIRDIFGNALKDNNALEMAVLTGCLRISKESIFTGLNNFLVRDINDAGFGEHFGFTEDEVRAMLSYYGIEGSLDTVREWYDGYRFGTSKVYCPWDVNNYVMERRNSPDLLPASYWANTSGNGLLLKFIEDTGMEMPSEIEALIAGDSIIRTVRQELTYRELDEDTDNIWSVLYMTGYLTSRDTPRGDSLPLTIPNHSIRKLFVDKVKSMFNRSVKEDRGRAARLGQAFLKGDAATAEKMFNEYLKECISIRDTSIKREMKENFYHGYLLGILSACQGILVLSNQEGGDGYADITMEDSRADIGAVIEVKYAEGDRLEEECQGALGQIKVRGYADGLLRRGMQAVLTYGVACFRRKCKVMQGETVKRTTNP